MDYHMVLGLLSVHTLAIPRSMYKFLNDRPLFPGSIFLCTRCSKTAPAGICFLQIAWPNMVTCNYMFLPTFYSHHSLQNFSVHLYQKNTGTLDAHPKKPVIPADHCPHSLTPHLKSVLVLHTDRTGHDSNNNKADISQKPP